MCARWRRKMLHADDVAEEEVAEEEEAEEEEAEAGGASEEPLVTSERFVFFAPHGSRDADAHAMYADEQTMLPHLRRIFGLSRAVKKKSSTRRTVPQADVRNVARRRERAARGAAPEPRRARAPSQCLLDQRLHEFTRSS